MTNTKGDRLRQIIKHTGFSQKKFAEKVDLQPGYLNMIVNGSKDLSGGVLDSISNEFGETYNIGWLISGKGEMLLKPESNQVGEPPMIYGKGTLESRVDELERRADRTERLLEALLQYREGK